MKLAQDNNIMLSNSPVPETHHFGVTDMRIIMEVLTKLYSNPIQTLTQEYICNARDAHREIKQSKKIEIVAPTLFNAVMKIRDYGPGLSPDRIKSVFIYYGASTKRDTNSQTGGFGIGAKSAWSYTDSFIIVSYHDGIKRTYNAHKSKGTGHLDKIAEETTNEPNGVSIEIAVNPQDVQRFRNAIIRSTFFWKDSEKPVIKGIDSSEMPEYKPKFTEFSNIHVFDYLPNVFDANGTNSVIVVDGIAYPNRHYTPKITQKVRGQYAIFIDTGHVDVAPNREELINDDKTKNYLIIHDNKGLCEIESYITKEINVLPSMKDALKVAAKLKTHFNTEIKFNNYIISHNEIQVFDFRSNHNILLGKCWLFSRNKLQKMEFYNVVLSEIDNIFYDDMPNEPATKKVWRVKKVLNAGNIRRFKLLRNDLDAQIIKDFGAKPLSSIDASDYTVQRQAKAAVQKLEICLHYFTYKLNPTQVNINNVTDTIVYDLHDSQTCTHRNSNKILKFINGLANYKVAFIAKNCEQKIKGNKHFIKYEDFVKNYNPSDNEIKYYFKQKCYFIHGLEKFNIISKEIKDKTLQFLFELSAFNPGNSVGNSILPDDFIKDDNKIVKQCKTLLEIEKFINKNYPLFSSFEVTELNNIEYRKDVIDYINHKYKENTL